MLVFGYRGEVDWGKARAAFKRCTELPAGEIDRLIRAIKTGSSVNIPDDLVLNEELTDLGIKIR